MKRHLHILLGIGLAGALLGVTNAAPPTSEKAPTAKQTAKSAHQAAAPAKKRKAKGYPFRGKLGAVDKVKHTITVTTKHTKRVFPVNEKTKYTKHGKPAKLTDGVVGEEVAGYVRKLEGGKLLASSVRFGPKPKTTGKHAKRSPARKGASASPPPAAKK